MSETEQGQWRLEAERWMMGDTSERAPMYSVYRCKENLWERVGDIWSAEAAEQLNNLQAALTAAEQEQQREHNYWIGERDDWQAQLTAANARIAAFDVELAKVGLEGASAEDLVRHHRNNCLAGMGAKDRTLMVLKEKLQAANERVADAEIHLVTEVATAAEALWEMHQGLLTANEQAEAAEADATWAREFVASREAELALLRPRAALADEELRV